MAIGTRDVGADVGLVQHSDRGSQYTSEAYGAVLSDAGIAASLGSVGDAYDNAMAESWVDSLKTELISDRVWRSFEQLEHELVRWIGWYNARRLHSSIGDVPPDELEAAWAAENDGDPPDRSKAALNPNRSAARMSPGGPDQAESPPVRAPDGAGEPAQPPDSARPTDSLRQAADEPEALPTTVTTPEPT